MQLYVRWQLGRYAWKVLERVILTMGGVGGRCKKGLPAQVGSQGKHRNTQVRAVVGGGMGGKHLRAERTERAVVYLSA